MSEHITPFFEHASGISSHGKKTKKRLRMSLSCWQLNLEFFLSYFLTHGLTMWPRIESNLRFSCFSLPSHGSKGAYHHTEFGLEFLTSTMVKR
jgi:hypothetical protein